MGLTLSCGLATSLHSHEHARIAEELGYSAVWMWDTAPVCSDVWIQLARAADRTQRIKLGTAVIAPGLRHPITTATAISTLVSIAGQERVAIGVGSGFTGAIVTGQRPSKWTYVAEYIKAVRELLRGEVVEWDGGKIKLLHGPLTAPDRPIDVPFLVAADGPKGIAVAHEVGDGIIGAFGPHRGWEWSLILAQGTVLGEGEDPGSTRARAAGGPGAAVMLHYAVEFDSVSQLPFAAAAWANAYVGIPADVRHLVLHEGHGEFVSDIDRPFVDGDVLSRSSMALSASGWRERVAALHASGATEVAFTPAGPDIPRELEAFAKAVMP
ncbi:LLM class flavin-dependent oxidoreductase [Rhodococcus koreensis]|uniref:LLM class flavin-dependent oxidoreductase n=1 Tax=Rhodococcus koreensis TaxID=99653 RepID=UPI00366B864C